MYRVSGYCRMRSYGDDIKLIPDFVDDFLEINGSFLCFVIGFLMHFGRMRSYCNKMMI